MGRDLTSRLRERAQREPERRAYTFLTDGEEEQGSLTYAGLDARARAIAAALQERCRPGDRALLLCPPGLEFAAAFFGCLYAGVVAVPAYPPRSARALPRLRSIPVYTMVSHSNIPYSECVERHRRQERIARWLGLDLVVGVVTFWVYLRNLRARRRAIRQHTAEEQRPAARTVPARPALGDAQDRKAS